MKTEKLIFSNRMTFSLFPGISVKTSGVKWPFRTNVFSVVQSQVFLATKAATSTKQSMFLTPDFL